MELSDEPNLTKTLKKDEKVVDKLKDIWNQESEVKSKWFNPRAI
jgi:hypothetical protein